MKMLRWVLLAVAATTAGVTMTASARADHDQLYAAISAHAEEIACASRELKGELRDEFRGSRVYGDLIATNARVRSKASYLQAVIRPGRNISHVEHFIIELDESICRLDGLLHEAQYRSARGFDPPLECAHEVEFQLARMREAIRCIRRDWAILSPSVVRVYRDGIGGYSGDWRYDQPFGFPGSIGRSGVTWQTGPLSVHFHR